MTACEFASVGWVITLVGFLYNNHTSNTRETRKEIRAKLDQLNNGLDSLFDASKNYYLVPDAILFLEITKIHEKISTCATLIENLSKIKGFSIDTEFYKIYDKITGGDFESKKHKPGEHNTEFFIEAIKLKKDLIKKSEDWFHKNFQ
jgi:hypothetical protein